jgi:hypothetical protein
VSIVLSISSLRTRLHQALSWRSISLLWGFTRFMPKLNDQLIS